jgi:hypothetical protein
MRPDQHQFSWKRGEYDCDLCVLDDKAVVAWIEPRPHYCDRGHWQVKCTLATIDYQDGFPRYYMSKKVAMFETERFLKWRLWKLREDNE